MAAQCVSYIPSLYLLHVFTHAPLPSPPTPTPLPTPASYLLTRKDVFFTKSEFCQVISAMLHGKDARIKVDLPPPALWKVGRGVYVWWDGRVWWCKCFVVARVWWPECGCCSIRYACCVHHAGGRGFMVVTLLLYSVLCACLVSVHLEGTAVYCTVHLYSWLESLVLCCWCVHLCVHMGGGAHFSLLYMASIVLVHAHTLHNNIHLNEYSVGDAHVQNSTHWPKLHSSTGNLCYWLFTV